MRGCGGQLNTVCARTVGLRKMGLVGFAGTTPAEQGDVQ